jgi:hypothetical protein
MILQSLLEGNDAHGWGHICDVLLLKQALGLKPRPRMCLKGPRNVRSDLTLHGGCVTSCTLPWQDEQVGLLICMHHNNALSDCQWFGALAEQKSCGVW